MLGIIGNMKTVKNFSLEVENLIKLQDMSGRLSSGNLSKAIDLLIEQEYQRHSAVVNERLRASREALGEIN